MEHRPDSTSIVGSTAELSDKEDEWGKKKKRNFFTWYTVQTAGAISQEDEIKVSIRELGIYIVYLSVLLIGAFGMTATSAFYYSEVIRQIFVEKPSDETNKGFKDCILIEDFWSYMMRIFIPNLFWMKWYKDYPTWDGKDTVGDERNLLYENKILGYPRIRQVRVRSDSCTVHKDFRRMFRTCFAAYSYAAEDKDPFGPEIRPAWYYASQKDLDGKIFWGMLGTYGGGGYYQDVILSNEKDATASLMFLRESAWIRRGTRAVFIDFTTYNANVNLFCIIKLILELPPTGGVVPNWRIKTVKLTRYVTIFDHFVLSAELMFLIFTVYYTAEEIQEIVFFKLKYFRLLWSYVDLFMLATSYLCIIYRAIRTIKVEAKMTGLLKDQERHLNFQDLGDFESRSNDFLAILIFFAFLKILKFLSFDKTMIQLSTTLRRCLKDLFGFGIMFFIVFFAFAVLGCLLFGNQVEEFSTFQYAVFTLLRAILGEFDYEKIEQAHRILGPLFFIAYIFFVFFILLNMFLAIINDAYSEVKRDRTVGSNVGTYIKNGINNFFIKIKCKQPPRDHGKLTTKKVRKLLQESNFTDWEINNFFRKYGIHPNKKEIDEKTAVRILNDLDKAPLDELVGTAGQSGSSISKTEFNGLQERVETIEQAVENVIERVDSMLRNLQELAEAP